VFLYYIDHIFEIYGFINSKQMNFVVFNHLHLFTFHFLEFVGHTMEDADLSHKGRTNTPVKERQATATDSNVSYADLMARIRNVVLRSRLRVGFIYFAH